MALCTLAGEHSPLVTSLVSVWEAFAEFERALIRAPTRPADRSDRHQTPHHPRIASATREPEPGRLGTGSGREALVYCADAAR